MYPLFPAVSDLQQGSCGHRKQDPSADTSCIGIFWPTEYTHFPSNSSSSPSGSRRHHLNPYSLHHLPQSQVVIVNTFQVFPDTIISAYMKKHICRGLLLSECWKALADFPLCSRPTPKQLANMSQQVMSSVCISVPCRKGTVVTYHLFLVPSAISENSLEGDPNAFFIIASLHMEHSGIVIQSNLIKSD